MRTAFHRLMALLLLTAYAVNGTALVSGLFAMAASLDGSHDVMVQVSEGSSRLTLHHRSGQFTPHVRDHRHCIAQWLVRLSSASHEGDHCLACSTVDGQSSFERSGNSASESAHPPAPAVLIVHAIHLIPRDLEKVVYEKGVQRRHTPAGLLFKNTVQMLI